MKKLFAHRLAGTVLVAWGTLNTAVLLLRYGLQLGAYFWFCNLSLFLSGLGILFLSRNLVVLTLSLAIFTQGVWIVDHLFRIFFHQNLLGTVEFLYQPGMPQDEFLLTHYHFFIIPLLCYFLPTTSSTKNRLLIGAILLNVSVFLISRFGFSSELNVNCAHKLCFGDWKWATGNIYLIVFAIVIFVTHVGLSRLVWRAAETGCPAIWFHSARNRTKTLVTILVLGIFLTGWDWRYKVRLPSFKCGKGAEDNLGRIDCRFTQEYSDHVMQLFYEVRNKTTERIVCDSSYEIDGREEIMHREIDLLAQKSTLMPLLVVYPNSDVVANFKIACVLSKFR